MFDQKLDKNKQALKKEKILQQVTFTLSVCYKRWKVKPHKLYVHSFVVFSKVKQTSFLLTSDLISGADLAIDFEEYLQGKHEKTNRPSPLLMYMYVL